MSKFLKQSIIKVKALIEDTNRIIDKNATDIEELEKETLFLRKSISDKRNLIETDLRNLDNFNKAYANLSTKIEEVKKIK